MSDVRDLEICPICNEPIKPEDKVVAGEDGQSVHDYCVLQSE